MEKVRATDAALRVIEQLQQKYGDILFEQSAGCCDGTVPMCYEASGHYISSQLLHVGDVGGVPYYVDKRQYDYMKHTRIVVDAIEGRGAAFSLESAEGFAFLAKSEPLV